MKIRNLVLGALCGITFFSCSASGGGKRCGNGSFYNGSDG